jgi:hypothetical protein
LGNRDILDETNPLNRTIPWLCASVEGDVRKGVVARTDVDTSAAADDAGADDETTEDGDTREDVDVREEGDATDDDTAEADDGTPEDGAEAEVDGERLCVFNDFSSQYNSQPFSTYQVRERC